MKSAIELFRSIAETPEKKQERLNFELFTVLAKCDEAAVDKCLENGANILAKVKNGKGGSTYGGDVDLLPALFEPYTFGVGSQLGGFLSNHKVGDPLFTSLELAIKKGADINGRSDNFYGATALIIATAKGSEKIVDLLLKNGADVSLQDSRGERAEDRARYLNYTNLIKKLSVAALEKNLSNKSPQEVEALRAAFAKQQAEEEAKQEQDKKDSALRQACYDNKPEKVTRLLAEGANAYAVNANRHNAGTAAAHEGSRQALKALFDAGVDLTREDSHGKSAATHRNSAEFVTNLISQKRAADALKELREEVTRLNKALGFKNGTKRIPKREETLAAKRVKHY